MTFQDIFSGEEALQRLPKGAFQSLVLHLEELLATGTAEECRAFVEQLVSLQDRLLAGLDGDVKESLFSETPSPWQTVFELGEIDAVQQLLSYAGSRRETEIFLAALRDERYASYFKALFHRDLSNYEIATRTKERPETVSRKLKELREAGITDFQKRGTKAINFLTPAARAALPDMLAGIEQDTEDEAARQAVKEGTKSVEASNALKELLNSLDPGMQSATSFSSKTSREREYAF